MSEGADDPVASKVPKEAPYDDRFLRGAAAAMVAAGLVSAVCWALSRRYLGPFGTSWVADGATLASLVEAGAGGMVLAQGERRATLARNVLLAMFTLSFVVAVVPKSGGVGGFMSLVTGPLLVGWGRPSKGRAIIGFVALAAGLGLLVTATERKLRYEPGRGPPVACEAFWVEDEGDPLGTPDDLPPKGRLGSEGDVGHETHYLVLTYEDAHFAEARAAADAYVGSHVRLRPDLHVHWESLPAERGTVLRTHVLRDAVVFASPDASRVEVSDDNALTLELRKPAAERFRDASRARARIAIALDGVVHFVFSTRTEIADGRLSLKPKA